MSVSHIVRPLEQSRLIVTGGTSGTGLATALAFAGSGLRTMALIGRNAERGEAARAKVLAAFPDAQVEFIAADAADAMQAQDAVDRAGKAMGGIDILVNSTVAAVVPQLFHLIPIEQLAAIAGEQMIAPIHMCRAAMPWMREQNGGAIVNIASDAGKATTPGESVIGAAMAGIIMFTRTLAMEAKRSGIRVNAITPSLIEGTIAYHRTMGDEFSNKLFSKAVKMAQLGLTQPEDLAGMIVFLCGPGGARITGQAISINGGISA
ncbi:SDR family NAD(P)-dependent oxidoreductase [Novosphingobium colocasiae]|uniref:3-oxoacyl-ACP reductase n=1 Tax=Novosphingobium colocasiae TaxID=1256513 RepID=A0A918UHZ1_9SPHN|nr:SDR family oxidoreductase [Novosphingobium colocasiae]GGZ13312.1 3-oxoacyl-ACP reductase [Novosphingobium colocasiae]